jgi:hypothetical protein
MTAVRHDGAVTDPGSADRTPGLRIDRVVYATVVLMSVLAVYDGWQDLATFAGVAAVILGPLLALALAHLFADVLNAHAELRRPLTAAEWKHHARDQVSWFAAAVPPLVVVGVGWISPADVIGTIAAVLWTAVVTLVVLSAIAGRRAGLRGWRWWASAAAGGLVGLVVIGLQVLLKPH